MEQSLLLDTYYLQQISQLAQSDIPTNDLAEVIEQMRTELGTCLHQRVRSIGDDMCLDIDTPEEWRKSARAIMTRAEDVRKLYQHS